MNRPIRESLAICLKTGFFARKSLLIIGALIVHGSLPVQLMAADAVTAKELVRAAMDHWRGTSSYSEMTMRVNISVFIGR